MLKSKSIFSIEAIMRDLENLTVPISTFIVTPEQHKEIESKMSICPDCHRWKHNYNLLGKKCYECSGRKESKRKEKIVRTRDARRFKDSEIFLSEEKWLKNQPRNYNTEYDQTVYLSVRSLIYKGKNVMEALKFLAITQRDYQKIPISYRERLKDIKREHKYYKGLR